VNGNRAAVGAGCACLAAPDAVEARGLEVVAARDRFARGLAGLGIPSWPSQANFVLAEPGGDDVWWYEGLARRGFLVRAGSEFGLRGHLRVTVGPSELMSRVAGALMAVRDELLAGGAAGGGGGRPAARRLSPL